MKTNRDMLYRAFGLMSADDAALIAKALRADADTRFVFATRVAALGGYTPVELPPEGERSRLYDLADIADAAAAELRRVTA